VGFGSVPGFVFEPVGSAFKGDDVGMVEEAVEDR
jgi:hypothetical protein